MEQKKPKKSFLPGKRVSVVRTIAVREGSVLYGKRYIQSPGDAVELLMPFVKNADKEQIIVCCLNGKNEPISLERVAIGTVNQCLCGMREVFKYAILCNAVSLILFHNHPSGNPEPSSSDIKISEKVKSAGELLDITVLDHIILAEDGFCSIAERLMWRDWNGSNSIVA